MPDHPTPKHTRMTLQIDVGSYVVVDRVIAFRWSQRFGCPEVKLQDGTWLLAGLFGSQFNEELTAEEMVRQLVAVWEHARGEEGR